MKNKENFETFYEKCVGEFAKYIDSARVKLRIINSEYQELEEQENKLKTENLNLMKIYDQEVVSLAEDDVQDLQKIIDIQLRKRNLESKEIFFLGGQELFNYLKRIGTI